MSFLYQNDERGQFLSKADKVTSYSITFHYKILSHDMEYRGT